MDENENVLHFILKGEINVLFNEKNPAGNATPDLTKLKKGETFGDLTFVTGERRLVSAKCLSVTHVAFLKRKDFLQAIREFPEDYEKFCYFKDKIYLLNQPDCLKLACFSCKQQTHLMRDCNLLHYVPKKPSVILRYVRSEDQPRNYEHHRLVHPKFNSKSSLANVQSQAFNFIKILNYNEDSRIVPESDLSGEDESGSMSSLLNPTITEFKHRKSLGSALAVHRRASVKVENLVGEENEEEGKKIEGEKPASPLTGKPNFEKYNKLRINTKREMSQVLEEGTGLDINVPEEKTDKTPCLPPLLTQQTMLVSPTIEPIDPDTQKPFHRGNSIQCSDSDHRSSKVKKRRESSLNSPIRGRTLAEDAAQVTSNKNIETVKDIRLVDRFNETFDVDRMMGFRHYFTEGNYEKVLKRFKKIKSMRKGVNSSRKSSSQLRASPEPFSFKRSRFSRTKVHEGN